MTPLQRHAGRDEMIERGWIDEHEKVIAGFKTAEQGAATQVWAAISPLLHGMGGVYCENCDIAAPAPDDEVTVSKGVRSWAMDPEQTERLWALSAARTGLDAFARRCTGGRRTP